ncbi:phage holin [Streptococcus moroccensis]|uniref:Phi LC3 family holin n=1 Tax=Streptococcus moroccensis TaxID=1451356 RepID=A0ABT9YQ05_9STRE|nr:phage holin [Streptococcus moroccensis]MDQ0221972.1 phi LC3 family holin [Streptococcus moroccensis]
MNINWTVRLKNKNFWLTIVPALALALQAILKVFGMDFDFGETVNNLLVVVNTVFAVLAILGVVNDPTTAGLSDSERALGYTEPK